jgi:protein-S-isoprenylcysteine O-methyltransferase Ste14
VSAEGVHLAHAEEAEARREFLRDYGRYAARVPAWIPRLRSPECRVPG